MIAAACVMLTVGVLLYVFSPPATMEQSQEKTRLAFLRERKEQVYENLRDLNFEYKAGKLSEADYALMRASMEDEAVALLAEMERLAKLEAGAGI